MAETLGWFNYINVNENMLEALRYAVQHDRDVRVRAEAARSILDIKITTDTSEVISLFYQLLDLLCQGSNDDVDQKVVKKALTRIIEPVTRNLCQRLKDDVDPQVRISISQKLKSVVVLDGVTNETLETVESTILECLNRESNPEVLESLTLLLFLGNTELNLFATFSFNHKKIREAKYVLIKRLWA